MNGKKTTIKSKLEAIASKKPKRLMGFKEWCEKVYEPSKRMRQERLALLEARATKL
jgi:hypothetical protein